MDRVAEQVNDIHSRLNATSVSRIARPRDIDELRAEIRAAANRRECVAVSGGRHAMGGQQFARGALLLDTRDLHRVIRFDAGAGTIEMEAGADWPAVIRATHEAQPGADRPWGIRQKQTGADELTLGGAISANAHGRGLFMRPFVDDVEALTLVDAGGELVRCSRDENAELFALVAGGYGLFGAIATVTLRLGPRLKVARLVDILDIDEAIPLARRRASEGCLYGDFQYAIDALDESFLRRGVGACYKPAAQDAEVSDASSDLSHDDWIRLLKLAHTDKRAAFRVYAAHYLASHGRVYWSDTMQLSTYIPSYDQFVKEVHNPGEPLSGIDESLMIGEQYVPPDSLLDFLREARQVLRETGVEDIYGTIRTIQPDEVSFLAWAREHFACVIFNLRTRHDAAGIERTARTFRGLNDAALRLGGSFYLTYHRWSTRQQVEAAYPQFARFLELKRQHDPQERFVSDWYRHHRDLFR
jgi:FAD/FMN-containing dehydrogenase